MFKKIKMEGKYWGVFLVNPSDAKDRYLLTNPLDRGSDADHFVSEFQRIAGHKLVFTEARCLTECQETDDEIGVIRWYAPWRRYVLFPTPTTLFDVSCLREIADFIERQMEARRVNGE